MWDRFTQPAQKSIARGQSIAGEHGHASIDVVHLFLGVLESETDAQSRVESLLTVTGISRTEATLYAQSALEPKTATPINKTKWTAAARRVFQMAAHEANLSRSPLIGPEHLFIACLRRQRRSSLSDIMRPLGFDAAALRQHLVGLIQSEVPHREGHPLNHVSPESIAAIESSYEAMRASFCGRISNLHLLLGLLHDEDAAPTRLLREAGIDTAALQRAARAHIASDGQIATPQRKFTPAAKRALERAKKRAVLETVPLIEPQHLLMALLPAPDSPLKTLFSAPDDSIARAFDGFDIGAVKTRYQQLLESLRPRRLEMQVVSKPPSTMRFSALTCAGAILLGRLIHVTGQQPSGKIASIVLSYLAFSGLGALLVGTAISSRSSPYSPVWTRCLIAYIIGLILAFSLSRLG